MIQLPHIYISQNIGVSGDLMTWLRSYASEELYPRVSVQTDNSPTQTSHQALSVVPYFYLATRVYSEMTSHLAGNQITLKFILLNSLNRDIQTNSKRLSQRLGSCNALKRIRHRLMSQQFQPTMHIDITRSTHTSLIQREGEVLSGQ